MARKTRINGLTAYLNKWLEQTKKDAIEKQCQMLANYAKDKIQELGAMIQTYNSTNHMDRTGNLLDSLCWGVSYNHKLFEGGFYRGKTATKDSELHEWMPWDFGGHTFPVDGHALAQKFIESNGGDYSSKGFRVFFAILAPYWGYWEKGFTLKSNFGHTEQFRHFAVMSQFYDVIKPELSPMKVREPRVSVATYEYDALQRRTERYGKYGWKSSNYNSINRKKRK